MRDEVCVVGGGGAGLAAARALAARGIPYKVFEARDGIGGMWRYGSTFAYKSLESNTSRYRTSFRAHRISLRGRPFIPHAEFLAYLEGFAARFRLQVELGARVASAVPLDGGWEVAVEGRSPVRFRALIVATGVLGKPRRRALPGTFAGRRLHSAEYSEPVEFAGQDVVITGMGASALEIAGDLAGHAGSITLAVRTGMHAGPKSFGSRVPLDLSDTSASALLPWSVRRAAFGLMLRRAMRTMRQHGFPAPSHRLFDEPLSVSDSFWRALSRGQIAVRAGIERFDGDQVVLRDGSAVRADAVIEASGFEPNLSFLPDDLCAGYDEHHMPLLRGIAHPTAAGLYFIGFCIGPGALLPSMEAQAGWAAAAIDGAVALPTADEIEAERRLNVKNFSRPDTVWRDRLRYIRSLKREVKAGGARSRAGAAR